MIKKKKKDKKLEWKKSKRYKLDSIKKQPQRTA